MKKIEKYIIKNKQDETRFILFGNHRTGRLFILHKTGHKINSGPTMGPEFKS